MLTVFGIAAVSVMVVAYALDRRHPVLAFVFAGGCSLSSLYAFLVGSPPLGVVEALWAGLALKRALRAGSRLGQP